MTRVYLIRHCEAMGNVLRLFQGTSDYDISELGARQLEYLSRHFADIPIDKIYSSPMVRAFKTAEAVAASRDIPIIKEPQIIEICGGIIEAMPFSEAFSKYPLLADQWNNHPEDFHPPEGEAMRDGYERIYNAVLRLAGENSGKTIALATHGGVLRLLLCRLLYGDISHLKDTNWSGNCSVTLLEIATDGKIEVKFYCDNSFIPSELLPKRNSISSFAK